MGFIELANVAYALPGGWTLFEGVSFRVPEGEHAGLVGANGIGKSTLLRLIVGDDHPTAGSIQTDGRVGLMRQFIGSDARPTTVRDFLLAYAEPRVAEAAIRVAKAERWMHDHPGEDPQMRYADALANWGEAGGYETEVVFDQCTDAAFGQGYPECADRKIETLSGGERKRLALEVILRSRFDTVMLDEPDNALDIEGKRWLEDSIAASSKTVLFVSHDRTVLDRAATRIVTLEGHSRGPITEGSRATRRRAMLGSTGWTRTTAGTRRSIVGSRRWSRRCGASPRTTTTGPPRPGRRSTGSTGTRSARSRPTRPTCRTSGCGSRAAAPARWRSG